MLLLKKYFSLFLIILPTFLIAQDVALFQQFNGQYDYLAFGNTLNLTENGSGEDCVILTQSAATFTLQPGQEVVAAYLYWAGSGTGDFEVKLNNAPILAERTFSYLFNSGGTEYVYFAASTDVTAQLTATGNGVYTLSELNLSQVIPTYCSPPGTGTNFGGWAVTVVYEDASLPINQVNIFDGLQGVSDVNQELTIVLENLLVLDNAGAKIGFLAWEGDSSIAVNETLRINGNILSNAPLNPADNAFNGTNSFTGSAELYNMDIDFYSIENFINPGDTSATIELTSSQDFVMVNNIVTVLNTELPDATISMDTIVGGTECGNREITIDYTVYNLESTAILPANTPIAFYADQTLVGQTTTVADIPINGSESGTIILAIPNSVPADFILKAVVDDTGNGTGVVNELDEDNNEDEVDFHLLVNPIITGIIDLEKCDVLGTELFDLTEATAEIDPIYALSFHLSLEAAQNNEAPILNPETYENITNPQTVYIRVATPECFLTDNFTIEVLVCPLPDASITLEEMDACRGRAFTLVYTVFNIEATGPLPAGTSIAFYTNGFLAGLSQTMNTIPIGGSEAGEIIIFPDESLPDIFTILAVVDDDGNGNGSVEELNEGNNTFEITVSFVSIPPIPTLPDLLLCDEGFNTATFDLTVQDELISTGPEDVVLYYTTLENAIENQNPISDPEQYQNGADPQIIYVRLENEICFATASFLLTTENCPPFIPQGFSPNGDGINDTFEISNLLNIYEAFELKIYSREGNQIHTARTEDGFWDGIATEGLLFKGSLVPVGTYYYVLYLNDPEYPEPFLGWVYLNY